MSSYKYLFYHLQLNIRKSLKSTWPEIDILGCHFHYCKALWKRVQTQGMKSIYSKNTKLNNLVRAALGLPFVPIERIQNGEAMKVLTDLANEIDEPKVKKFAIGFLKYIDKTWLKGNYALETWNLFLHEGVTTNNYAEGYNSKLGRKKVIGSHPNVYLLASVIKEELGEAHDDGDSAALGIEVKAMIL